jgi:DNA-binding NtrC family response regulator
VDLLSNLVALVIESDPATRTSLTMALQSRGFAVLLASNVAQAEAVSRKHSEPIALLLADSDLSEDHSGIELADLIVGHRPDIAVVIFGSRDVEAKATAKGYSFLAKPFSEAELAERVLESLLAKITKIAKRRSIPLPPRDKDKS